MTVGSLFSGIGGLDEGLRRAGWEHVFFCESEPYRRDVLRARFPGVPVYDDVRAVGESAGRAAADGRGAPVDLGGREAGPGLLCGGFPCQDLSVAGRRKGLAGERSGLFHEFARIADALRPRWLLVENVPGLLSSNGGRDFGVVLGTLADLGYGVAWRVVDSRFFGVPQRRRRVFIVGALAVGDPRAAAECAGEILAVGTGCARHPKTNRSAGAGAGSVSALGTGNGGSGGWRIGAEEAAGGQLIASTLKSQRGKDGGGIGPEETLIADTVRSHPSLPPPSGPTMARFSSSSRRRPAMFEFGLEPCESGAAMMFFGRRSEDDPNLVAASGVRRLTPTECERLQGLPDGWTQLGDTADSKRYAALGDAVTANVAEWIGARLAATSNCVQQLLPRLSALRLGEQTNE